jgi:hypothetical protein
MCALGEEEKVRSSINSQNKTIHISSWPGKRPLFSARFNIPLPHATNRFVDILSHPQMIRDIISHQQMIRHI